MLKFLLIFYVNLAMKLVMSTRESAGALVVESSQEGGIDFCKTKADPIATSNIVDLKNGNLEQLEFASCELHPQGCDAKTVDWIFFVHLINFSFWSDLGMKFAFTYKGISYDGYFAVCACVS
jgi:hypothetical protein